jgi:hypothetical protein
VLIDRADRYRLCADLATMRVKSRCGKCRPPLRADHAPLGNWSNSASRARSRLLGSLAGTFRLSLNCVSSPPTLPTPDLAAQVPKPPRRRREADGFPAVQADGFPGFQQTGFQHPPAHVPRAASLGCWRDGLLSPAIRKSLAAARGKSAARHWRQHIRDYAAKHVWVSGLGITRVILRT